MLNIPAGDPRAVAVIAAIHTGNLEQLERLLGDNPGLEMTRIVEAQGVSRTLLHIATDWPGHFLSGAEDLIAWLRSQGAKLTEEIDAFSALGTEK